MGLNLRPYNPYHSSNPSPSTDGHGPLSYSCALIWSVCGRTEGRTNIEDKINTNQSFLSDRRTYIWPLVNTFKGTLWGCSWVTFWCNRTVIALIKAIQCRESEDGLFYWIPGCVSLLLNSSVLPVTNYHCSFVPNVPVLIVLLRGRNVFPESD